MRIREAARLHKVVLALLDASQIEEFVTSFHFATWGYSISDDRISDNVHYVLKDEDEDTINAVIEAVRSIKEKNLVPHNCGAPACALGHFALRRDLQNKFKLTGDGYLTYVNADETMKNWDSFTPIFLHSSVTNYFGISAGESEELFGENGCAGATHPADAADYIAKFVDDKMSGAR